MNQWSSKVQFPKDTFVIRCTEEGFSPSKSSGNPMITLHFEVDRPESVEIAGEEYNVAGVKAKQYYPTIVFSDPTSGIIDEEKTAKAQERVKRLYENFGLKSDNINFENPVLEFKGKLVHALMYSKAEAQRRAPTKEQLAKGIKEGDVIKHPISGEPLVSYWPQVDEIYGPANADANKPY